MKLSPIFRDSYEVTDDDLDGMVVNIKKSDDDIAYDAIQRGRRFTGFPVTASSATQVNVGAGRLWFDGKRYYSDDPGGVTLDLNSLKPGLQKRIVAIVAWPEEIETNLETRDYEIDAETGVKEPRQVNTETFRHARLEAVAGIEAVSPVNPVIESTAVILAYVRMGASGIEAITRNDAALLDNLGDVAVRVGSLEDWREEVSPKIDTLGTELARIQSQLGGLSNQNLVYALAQDVAELKEKNDLPAAFVAYRSDSFLDASRSDTTVAGYAAKTEEGLRFPTAALDEHQLALFNPYNPDVKVSGTGIMLPAYDEIGSRIVKGGVGEMSLAQYAYELRTTTLLTMTRSRVRYGAEFEQSAGSAFFTGGSVSYSAAGALGVFQKAGETFQVYETGRVDPDGHKIYRLSQFWQDSLSTPYWSRLNSDQPITGYAFLESFVQPRDAWCTAIGVRISRKPADGLLWAGLCECVNGVPDITRMIALVSQPATFFTPEGGFGMNKVAIPPTFLQGGRSYAYVVMTGADYYHQVVETGTSPTTGTMFYGLNGGVLQSDPTRHLMFDLYYATFKRNRVEVDLGGMSLAGGIASIDILADAIVPDSTVLEYQVQIGGVWKALSESAASILAGLPNLLPLRVVMTGTADAMPGLKLAGSRCRFSRPATALNHYSEVATLAAPTSKITTRHRIRNFDTGQHALTTKILVGAGYATVETADVVQDTVRGDITERVCTFNLAAPVSSYKRRIEGSATTASNLFVDINATDVAE